jgi:hypothetical protein
VARPEWQIGKAIDAGTGRAKETLRIKGIRTIPQQPMPMQHAGRDHDQRSAPDGLSVQMIGSRRDTADGCDRRRGTMF